MPTVKVVILGTGGNCIDILETMQANNACKRADHYECVAFLDDNQSLWGTQLHDTPIEGPLEKAELFADCRFVNGIGSPRNYRKKPDILARTSLELERFLTLVHPTASVSPSALLGRGTVIMQNVTIASNVTVGNHVIILPGSIISHDARIGDFTAIAGGVCVSGDVTIGDSCYLGSNCSIIDNTTVGPGSLVGIGSVVIHDVAPNRVVAGNPARVIRSVSPL